MAIQRPSKHITVNDNNLETSGCRYINVGGRVLGLDVHTNGKVDMYENCDEYFSISGTKEEIIHELEVLIKLIKETPDEQA